MVARFSYEHIHIYRGSTCLKWIKWNGGMHIRWRCMRGNEMMSIRKNNLVNSRTNELAAENNVTEQDWEIATSLRLLGLFVQHETGDGHQVCALSIRTVIHLSLFTNPQSDDDGFNTACTYEFFIWIWRKRKRYDIICGERKLGVTRGRRRERVSQRW